MAYERATISEMYRTLQTDLVGLERILRELAIEVAGVTVLPPVLGGTESQAINQLAVAEYSGLDAVNTAIASYQDLQIKPQLSQKVARRAPGVLWFSPRRIGSEKSLKLVSLVQNINDTKSAIERYVTSTFHTRNERFEGLRSACPGVMAKHLYRRIRLFYCDEVESVRFAWLRKQLVSKPDKEKLICDLANDLVNLTGDRRIALEILMKRISATPELQLRTRRNVSVQPAANVVTASSTQNVNCPMPLIVMQDQQFSIKLLRNYDASKTRKIRSDKAKSELLGFWSGSSIEVHFD